MKCPSCGGDVGRIITTFRKTRSGGVRKVEGCRDCFQIQLERKPYTGRKIWSAYDAYGVKKTIQMNHDWIERTAAKAARNRRENAVISEGAFQVLVSESRAGRIRERRA